ncbi:MAG: HAMP domain-containing histidine kinase [Burkholderiaceae bacterium]|nr:HAMP domain-containing histidine kinase [Burkholderiaceae bacterium]
MSLPPAADRDDDGSAPQWRVLQYLGLTRLIIAIGLLLAIAALGTTLRGGSAPAYLAAAVVYFVGAAGLAVASMYLRRRAVVHVSAQIAFDLALISALMISSGGLRSGLVVLYLLPLAGASLLLPTAVVFFVCALVVITILLDALARSLAAAGAEASLFEAGLYGAMMFAVTALLRLLAQRLSAQEQLAQQRGRNLHNQLAINRLVIAQLEQGVVVVDAESRVRANNRAARVLFGLGPEAQLTGEWLSSIARLSPLVAAFRHWRVGGGEAAAGSDICELPELRLRARFVQPSAVQSDEFLIFIEDQRALDERAQQLKLASMGRLTASIAHEIRNPLAAISHASQLLVEDATDAGLGRLASIVRENTQRLNRLVDDILRVARREAPLGDDIELARFLPEWLDEFVRDRPEAGRRILLQPPVRARVKFERSHLRQVLYNLIDNALRYASDADGAVRLLVDEGSPAAALWVVDDGPGVVDSLRASLFEPFSTTHLEGTGLGLYIAREFCLANRCQLAYDELAQPGGGTRHGFVLRFAAADRQRRAADFLDTITPYE